MILLSGTLQMSTPSAPALLRCELGVFSVLDERLEMVSPGNHEGLFELESIKPHLLPSSDSTIQLGMMVILKRFSLTLVGKPRKSAAKKERRPFVDVSQLSLFEEQPDDATPALTAPQSAEHGEDNILETPVEPVKTVAEDETTELTAADTLLFGEHFILSETITLDAIESREKLGQQRDRLKQWGYRFDSRQQVWQRTTH